MGHENVSVFGTQLYILLNHVIRYFGSKYKLKKVLDKMVNIKQSVFLLLGKLIRVLLFIFSSRMTRIRFFEESRKGSKRTQLERMTESTTPFARF